jgi:hypothetical protein
MRCFNDIEEVYDRPESPLSHQVSAA